MNEPRTIFVTFAIQDAKYRDLLVAKARKEKQQCTFVEMAIKAPGDSVWQKHCRGKISGSDGFIALVSENTAGAAGVLWEMNCAREIGLPILGVGVDFAPPTSRQASAFDWLLAMPWKWEAITKFLEACSTGRGASGGEEDHVGRAARLAG